MRLLRELWEDEQGGDLLEYTLLMAFTALASTALFLASGGTTGGLWLAVNRALTQANPFDGAVGRIQGG